MAAGRTRDTDAFEDRNQFLIRQIAPPHTGRKVVNAELVTRPIGQGLAVLYGQVVTRLLQVPSSLQYITGRHSKHDGVLHSAFQLAAS